MAKGPQYTQPPLPFGQVEFVDPVSNEGLGYVDDFMETDSDEEFKRAYEHWSKTLQGHQEALTAKYEKLTIPKSENIGKTVFLSTNTDMGEQLQTDKKPDSVNPDQMHLPVTSPAELDELNKGWEPTPEQRTSHLASERALQKTPVSFGYLYESNKETDQGQLPIEDLEWQWSHHSMTHDEGRMEQARKMFPVAPSAHPNQREHKETIANAIYRSSIPTDALSSLSASIRPKQLEKADGSAYPNSMKLSTKMLDANAGPFDKRPSQVINHELGHVADYRSKRGKHVGVKGDRDMIFRPNGEQVYDHTVSAAGEGFADGIELRFGQDSRPPSGPYDPLHTYFDGYNPTWWSNPAHQASYVAHRAMAWSEGGRPHVSNEGELGTAEAVHTAGQNPHVRQAIRRNDLTSVARNLSEQFMETRKQGTQLSLLGSEGEYDVYDAENVDWDN